MMQTMNDDKNLKVPWGVTSTVGAVGTIVAAIMAVVAWNSGAHDQATVTAIVAGAVLVVTAAGRYLQAFALALRGREPVPPPPGPVFASGASPGNHITYPENHDPLGDPHDDGLDAPEHPLDPVHEMRDIHEVDKEL